MCTSNTIKDPEKDEIFWPDYILFKLRYLDSRKDKLISFRTPKRRMRPVASFFFIYVHPYLYIIILKYMG